MARGAAIDDERYPTPPPRILLRLVELPVAAVVWTIERLLARRTGGVSRAAASSRSPAAGREAERARRP